MNRDVLARQVLALALLTPSLGLAQGLPSGSIAGLVTSAVDGKPLKGVTVTARSPALQGLHQAVSAATGDCLLANLPAGEYTLELRLQGFRTVTRAAVRVRTSQRQEFFVAMALEAFSEEVVVKASSELVSMAAQSATTLTSAVLTQLPIPRTIESAVLRAPDVNANGPRGGITIAGGESYENTFNINGIQAQDNIRNTPEPLCIEDAIAEVTTLTSGISAEYGRFGAGAVDVRLTPLLRRLPGPRGRAQQRPGGAQGDLLRLDTIPRLAHGRDRRGCLQGCRLDQQLPDGSGYEVDGTDVILDRSDLYPVLGSGTVLWYMPIFVPAAPNDARTYSAYVNDTWRLSDRFTFNLGLRWDKNDARDAGGVRQSGDANLDV